MPASLVAESSRVLTRRRALAAAGCALIATVFFVAGFMLAPATRAPAVFPAVSQLPSASIRLPQPVPIGDFALDVVAGERPGAYTREQLLGHWTLAYFGYSHCPDLCRATLAILTQVAHSLADRQRSSPIARVLIGIDPARDTPARLGDFASSAGAGIVVLRGSERRVAGLARELGILYTRESPAPDGRYLIDHPATVLLIDPSARLRAGFPAPHDAARMVEEILDIEEAYADGGAR